MQFFHSSLKEMEKEYKAVVIKGRIVDSAGSVAILAWELVYKGISYLGNIIYKQALEFFHWLYRILYFNSALHFCSHTSLDFWPLPRGVTRGSVVKNLPAMQEMQETGVQFLGQEDPLEEGMATHSSILAWRIPWTEKTGGPQSVDHKETQLKRLSMHTLEFILL